MHLKICYLKIQHSPSRHVLHICTKILYITVQISTDFNSKKLEITYITSKDKQLNKLKNFYLMGYYQVVKGKEQKLILSTFTYINIHIYVTKKYVYSSPRSSTVLLSAVSGTHGQPWSENIKWKIPEINNS